MYEVFLLLQFVFLLSSSLDSFSSSSKVDMRIQLRASVFLVVLQWKWVLAINSYFYVIGTRCRTFDISNYEFALNLVYTITLLKYPGNSKLEFEQRTQYFCNKIMTTPIPPPQLFILLKWSCIVVLNMTGEYPVNHIAKQTLFNCFLRIKKMFFIIFVNPNLGKLYGKTIKAVE